MATALKDHFGAAVVESIARDIAAIHQEFDRAAFLAESLGGLESLELTERGWHVCRALQRHLPASFEKASSILIASLGPELTTTDDLGMGIFRYMPHVFFAAQYGLEHFEAAMRLQYELTKRFSAEFSIREYLVKHPEKTLRRLREWARDTNVHVRRLVSEGTRPRLPWAPRLRAFQKDPAPALALLELLKDDTERYVQRSVANNLNDVGKDHPEILLDVCRRWSEGAPEGRKWLIRHALRSLVKKGDARALSLLGFHAAPRVGIESAKLSPRRPRIGDSVTFSLDLVSKAKEQQTLLVDYVVHFVKSSGKTAAKVFKLRELVLPPGGRASLGGRISFAAMTTRRHHPGVHRLELLVNGVAFPIGAARVAGR